jgi:hypothetical protein
MYRRVSSHLLAELQKLHLEALDAGGESFEWFHVSFENLYPAA